MPDLAQGTIGEKQVFRTENFCENFVLKTLNVAQTVNKNRPINLLIVDELPPAELKTMVKLK